MERISLKVSLPRGPEHYWRMMTALTRSAGGFTITDIWQLTNSRKRQTIKHYIHVCRDEGHLEALGEDANGAVSYRVVNLNQSAPVIRRPNYAGVRGRIQQQLWTAMRGLSQFTIRELAVEASTDDIEVKIRAAKDFVKALTEAGFLTVIRPSRRLHQRGLFRLKPSMDTGPLAPAILKTRFIVDRNRKDIVATLGEAEEAA